ncbi:WD40 repeat domain-containing protein [Ktedonobacter racemifer]|uniref:WD40 repeat, subgroup n=1 Tax=Ktedonobacter racemifer DSM 44963 TaxID=485913 RepID=D6TXH1_KTERA|nr:PD40 domain-containing protein [Ktedonobacter racemifer]EFH84904.1 WD40 repeat, subgroup [Ktedonobacter racemifer DSM 44963]
MTSPSMSREPACRYQGHADGVFAVAWSPDSQYIASASWDLTVQIWTVANASHVLTYSGHADRVIAVTWSPDGKHIASGSWNQTVQPGEW